MKVKQISIEEYPYISPNELAKRAGQTMAVLTGQCRSYHTPGRHQTALYRYGQERDCQIPKKGGHGL